MLFWRLCCVTRTPPAAVSRHLSPLGAHVRRTDTSPCYEMKTKGCRGRGNVEQNKENVRDSCRTPSTLLGPKVEPRVGQHGTEGARFTSVLKATGVAKNTKPIPSTEIKIGYQGIECVRGAKPVLGAGEERALRHNTTRRPLNLYYRGELCGYREAHSQI